MSKETDRGTTGVDLVISVTGGADGETLALVGSEFSVCAVDLDERNGQGLAPVETCKAMVP